MNNEEEPIEVLQMRRMHILCSIEEHVGGTADWNRIDSFEPRGEIPWGLSVPPHLFGSFILGSARVRYFQMFKPAQATWLPQTFETIMISNIYLTSFYTHTLHSCCKTPGPACWPESLTHPFS